MMTTSETGALARIDQARRFLEQAKDLSDIKAVKNMAEAARLYARARDLGLATENEAAEVTVRAERRLGEVLAATPKQRPGQYQQRCTEGSVAIPPSLPEVGISHRESSDAQAVASLPVDDFEQIISETKAAGKRIAVKPLVREGRKRKRERADAAMARSRHEPRPADERQSPVNVQAIQDAKLRASFSGWLADAAKIVALSPSRVVEVLGVAEAERGSDTLSRLALWAERFDAARGDGSALRVVEGR